MLARYTELDVRDYSGLLHLSGDYRIVELAVESGGWLDGRTLAEVRPAEEGVLVLGVASPDGEWLGTPRGDTLIAAGDTLVVYGRTAAVEALEHRRRNAQKDHHVAVGEQARVEARERAEHPRYAQHPGTR
jgi:Trk K+ transport system NAD-binding subunit